MTENMEKTEAIKDARYALDPVAFAKALICAPLLVAFLGFWALGIPVVALFFGGPFYLALGTPVLLAYLAYRKGTPEGASALALATVLAGLAAIWCYGALNDAMKEIETPFWLGMFGLVMGPLWGFAFGILYNRWRNDLSRQPLPPLV